MAPKLLVPAALACLSALGTALPVSGQDHCACDSVLLDGVLSLRVERGDSDARRSVAQRVATMSYDEFQKGTAGGGGFSIAGFGLNASMSKTEFESRQSELIDEFNLSDSKVSSRELVERYGDPLVLAAWSACKEACTTQPGVRWWVKNYAPDSVDLVIAFVSPDPLNRPTWPIVDSVITGGTVSIGSPPAGKVFPPGQSLTPMETAIPIQRAAPNQPVRITIRLDGLNDVTVFIPKYIEPASVSAPESSAGPAPVPALDCSPPRAEGYTSLSYGDLPAWIREAAQDVAPAGLDEEGALFAGRFRAEGNGPAFYEGYALWYRRGPDQGDPRAWVVAVTVDAPFDARGIRVLYPVLSEEADDRAAMWVPSLRRVRHFDVDTDGLPSGSGCVLPLLQEFFASTTDSVSFSNAFVGTTQEGAAGVPADEAWLLGRE